MNWPAQPKLGVGC